MTAGAPVGRAAAAGLLAVVLAGCGPPGSLGPSRGEAGSPPAPPASAVPPASLPGAEPTPVSVPSHDPTTVSGAVVPCRPDAESLMVQFEVPPPPVELPATVPAALSDPALPEGAAIYGVGYPGDADVDRGPWVHYLVGPAGMACTIEFATAIEVTLGEPASAGRVRVVVPRSVGMNQLLACRYIADARAAAAPFASPGDCEQDPVETVTALKTTQPRDHAVLVETPVDPASDVSTLSLYLFQGDAGDGTSRAIECRLPATQRSTCLSAFRLFLAQADLPPDDVTSLADELSRLLE